MRIKDGWDGFGSSVNLNLSGVYKFNKNNPVITYKNDEFILKYKNENTAKNFIDKILKSKKLG